MIIGCALEDPYLAPVMHTLRHSPQSSFYRTMMVITILVGLTVAAYAENDRRAAGSLKSPKAGVVGTTLSPVTRAVASGVNALTMRRDILARTQGGKLTSGRDSSLGAPRIVSTRVASEIFTARIEMTGDEAQVDIAIYNMLGKRVMDVYKGGSSKGIHEHTQSISDLPEGVYMCVMQGNNFRKAEKFFFSR
ncbi:MAG: Secretion system C-terminal sorting domain [Bacteroidota bacterium]|jgi:hypothetical protein